MPVDSDRWYQNQIDLGNLPDENGYYHYIPNENEPTEKDWSTIERNIYE